MSKSLLGGFRTAENAQVNSERSRSVTTRWESLGTARLLEAEPPTADTLVPSCQRFLDSAKAPPTGQREHQAAAKALSSSFPPFKCIRLNRG